MLLPMAAMADKSGTCGENLTWTLVESTGTLTISGSGAMIDYTGENSSSYAPWYKDRAKIIDVIMDDGVTTIGKLAFYACNNLTSVTIPNSVTNIGESSFQECGNLKSVSIPNGVTVIKYHTFYHCGKLTTVIFPNSVTCLEDYVFSGCSSLTEITFPTSLTCIGHLAFAGCSGLTELTIPNSVTDIGEGAFQYCSNLVSVTLPNSITSINKATFYKCTSLTSIIIPNSVTSIGHGVFEECTSLTSITIPESVTSLSSQVFARCTGLTSVTMGNGVTELQTSLFSGCSSLSSFTIPDKVTFISDHAFYGCKSLTSITIPKSLTNIGNSVFEDCYGLNAVYISDLEAWCKIKFYCSKYNHYSNPLIYAKHLFLNNEEITDLVIPENVSVLGEGTFIKCAGLTSVTIPSTVTSIGDFVFAYCDNIRNVTSYITEPAPCSELFSEDTYRQGVLNIPAGTKDLYSRFDGWRDFLHIVEMAGPADAVLSINDGGNGVTQLLVDDAKPYFTLIFKADEGWKIHSVTLNDDDVTAKVGEDGRYTTPALTASSSINVVYEQSSSQGINAINGTPIQVRGNNGEVIINRNSSEITSVIVYQIDGKQILQQPLSDIETHISLPEGHVYIIKAGNQQYKVGL